MPTLIESTIAAALTAVALLLHWYFLRAFAPREPIGDERDFLQRGCLQDPHLPDLYLRVPLYPWLARIMVRAGADTAEARWRALNCAISALTIGAAALAAARFGGLPALLICAALALLIAERLVLGAHLWADPLLGLAHAGVCLLLAGPVGLTEAGMLGLIGVMAVMTRIDQVIVPAGVLLALIAAPGELRPAIGALVVAPAALALSWWTLLAWRRYRIPFPDTTWLFNLGVMQETARASADQPVMVSRAVSRMLPRWTAMSSDQRLRQTFDGLRTAPLRLAELLVRRSGAFFGPDTFVTQRLLPPLGSAYPALSIRHAQRLGIWLRWSFPLVTALALWAIVVHGSADHRMLPALLLFVALIAVHFRTRYRICAIPWLTVAGGQALASLPTIGVGPAHWLLFVAMLLGACVLTLRPAQIEAARAPPKQKPSVAGRKGPASPADTQRS